MNIEKIPLEQKTLYVCVNNVGRSQMGERFHNELAPGKADSAGVTVDEPGGLVHDWIGGADVICQAMDEIDLGIGENIRTQFDHQEARRYSQVIFMLESHQIPENLDLHVPNRLYWPLKDPRDKSIEHVRDIRDYIWANVGMIAMNKYVDLCPA